MILKLKNSKGFTMVLFKTNERAFEVHIENALVGCTREECEAMRLTDVDVQVHSAEQCYWGRPSDFDKNISFDMRCLWSLGKRLKAIFSLLGLIYNDNLHIENKSKVDCRETLHSGLENDTIREMIRSVVIGKVKVA